MHSCARRESNPVIQRVELVPYHLAPRALSLLLLRPALRAVPEYNSVTGRSKAAVELPRVELGQHAYQACEVKPDRLAPLFISSAASGSNRDRALIRPRYRYRRSAVTVYAARFELALTRV